MSALLQEKKHYQLQGRQGAFLIRGVLGQGSSCVAYHAIYEEGQNRTDCLLKEFNPSRLSMVRDDDTGMLSTAQTEDFQEGLAHFRESYRLQEELHQNPELGNFTPFPQGLYDGLGTAFTVTPFNHGKPYEETKDAFLPELLERIRAIAIVVEKYHRAGYLHLDVKPANLFIFPGTNHAILFDLDSVIKMNEMGPDAVRSIRYTQEWAAPELVDRRRWECICPATDLFSIGEILFYRLMGRHSEIWERRSFSEYPQLRDAPLLKAHSADGKLFSRLTEFFHHTLCASIKGRWQSAAEVLDALTELIKLARMECYLCSTSPPCADIFLGRAQELDEIHARLSEKHLLFLCGMGGIGKSELVKRYAKYFANDYDVVLFASYGDSLRWALVNEINIANLRRLEGETETDYCRRKLKMMEELCSPKDLLIIDNLDQDTFEGEEAKLWRKILNLNCTLLVTSRLDSWEFPKLPVEKLEKEEDLLTLFQYWSERKDDPKAAKKIIDFFDGHTLAVELAAKQIKASALTPKEYLARLYAQGLGGGGVEPVRKDCFSGRKTAAEHICVLFDMAGLNKESRKILRCMALLPREGIDWHLLLELCHLKKITAINELCDFSWLALRDGRLYIHPLIAEVAMLEGGPAEVYDDFLRSLREYLLYTPDAAPIVEGDDWREYVSSHATNMLSQHPEQVSSAIAWFFETASELFMDVRVYPLAKDYGRLAFQISVALSDSSETALAICDEMKDHWSYIGLFCEAHWYWEREEEIREKLGVLEKEFYLRKGRFFLDHDEYDQAEGCFEKERSLYGESPALSYCLKELAQRRP